LEKGQVWELYSAWKKLPVTAIDINESHIQTQKGTDTLSLKNLLSTEAVREFYVSSAATATVTAPIITSNI